MFPCWSYILNLAICNLDVFGGPLKTWRAVGIFFTFCRLGSYSGFTQLLFFLLFYSFKMMSLRLDWKICSDTFDFGMYSDFVLANCVCVCVCKHTSNWWCCLQDTQNFFLRRKLLLEAMGIQWHCQCSELILWLLVLTYCSRCVSRLVVMEQQQLTS